MLDTDLHQWAREFGDQHDRSISWVVNRAIKSAKEKVDDAGAKKSPTSKQVDTTEIDDAFERFYSAGLVKKSKQAAYKAFKSLVKEFKCNPMEFAELLAADIKNRINAKEFGVDALHPSTYLNQRRWDDEITNTGRTQENSRQSAAERIAAKNAAKYGGSGLGMATGGGNLRGAVDSGERGIPVFDVEPSFEQARSIDCDEWHQADN